MNIKNPMYITADMEHRFTQTADKLLEHWRMVAELERKKNPDFQIRTLVSSTVLSASAGMPSMPKWSDLFHNPILDSLAIRELKGINLKPCGPGGRRLNQLTYADRENFYATGATPAGKDPVPASVQLLPDYGFAYSELGDGAMKELLYDVEQLINMDEYIDDIEKVKSNMVKLVFLYNAIATMLNHGWNGNAATYGAYAGSALSDGLIKQIEDGIGGAVLLEYDYTTATDWHGVIIPGAYEDFAENGDARHLEQGDVILQVPYSVKNKLIASTMADTRDTTFSYNPVTDELSYLGKVKIHGFTDLGNNSIEVACLTRKANCTAILQNDVKLDPLYDFSINGMVHQYAQPMYNKFQWNDLSALMFIYT